MTDTTKDPAIIAAAIRRSGQLILREEHSNFCYTVEPRLGLTYLSPTRLLTWLPTHTGIDTAHRSEQWARRLMTTPEFIAETTPFSASLSVPSSQLDSICMRIAAKIATHLTA